MAPRHHDSISDTQVDMAPCTRRGKEVWIYLDPGRDVISVYFSTNGYISPVNNTVVAWFFTSYGSNHEGTMARAIVKRLNQ